MSEMIAALVGGCIVLMIVAFVLAYQDSRRKDANISTLKMHLVEKGAEAVRVTEQRDMLSDHLYDERQTSTALRDENTQLKIALGNHERSGNRLYREAMEDQQARQLQAALLLKNARRDVDDAYRVLQDDGK